MEETPKSVTQLDQYATWLDSKFKIPGTNIRFGLDALIGLIPGAGDILSYGMSSALVIVMAKNGASPMVLLRMIGNIILDVLIGILPIVGDLFDVWYKANRRNVQLYQNHLKNRKQPHSFGRSLLIVLFFLIALSIGLFYFLFIYIPRLLF